MYFFLASIPFTGKLFHFFWKVPDTYNQNKLLRKMLEYYEEKEQYEKCAKLHKLQVIN